ncbi:predicted protein [Nematostella vectensis]|uniref:E3 ubiquitin-protein ligase UBR4 N-terminal domain-containing protein n=1 Tax=Nematostella vectensis TaxID=45351 RepID=A7SWY5_NEMVE|nr:predicted protein [Nematostella vectensis]|eukprot:XP_001623873.1 predicted protein [Nematostella vectensis]
MEVLKETSKMRICLEKLVILTCIGMLYTPKDINVEHFQLLLFIFHNLSFAQREALLMKCSEALMAVAKSPTLLTSTPLILSRLLLLQDYMLHHFSLPPEELLKQILSFKQNITALNASNANSLTVLT